MNGTVYLLGYPRHLSYDQDWIEAFQQHFDAGRGCDLRGPRPDGIEAADLIVLLHSATAQHCNLPDWVRDAAQKRRGKLLMLTGNDYKLFDEKQAVADALAPDLIGTLCPNAPYVRHPMMHIPHAMNADRFNDNGAPYPRPISIGFRGYRYPEDLDGERNRIVDAFRDMPGADIQWSTFQSPDDYALWLRHCRATPASEAGMVGRKCVSSRHFDAIGSRTMLVMFDGEYSGCIKSDHYIRVERDLSNLDQVRACIMDPQIRRATTERAFAYAEMHHTYAHRMQTIEDSLWHSTRIAI